MENNVSVLYGVEDQYKDVTRLCMFHCTKEGILRIPKTDLERAQIFGDHVPGVFKHIIVRINDDEHKLLHDEVGDFNIGNVKLSNDWFDRGEVDPVVKLDSIHRNLIFQGGNIRDEYPEQMMSMLYIKPDSCVLEIGSNIGRNTMTIATILNDQSKLVTLECDPQSYEILKTNMETNGYDFNIINAALSARKLIQKGWETIPSETVLPGYFPVNTITYDELKEMCNMKFDTIVADCEGALFYILQDFPELMNSVTTMIMENDYTDPQHYIFVRDFLTNRDFKCVYSQGLGQYTSFPCRDIFFQVWERRWCEVEV